MGGSASSLPWRPLHDGIDPAAAVRPSSRSTFGIAQARPRMCIQHPRVRSTKPNQRLQSCRGAKCVPKCVPKCISGTRATKPVSRMRASPNGEGDEVFSCRAANEPPDLAAHGPAGRAANELADLAALEPSGLAEIEPSGRAAIELTGREAIEPPGLAAVERSARVTIERSALAELHLDQVGQRPSHYHRLLAPLPRRRLSESK
jgi:hypothetical protein